MKLRIVIALVGFSFFTLQAQENCLSKENLIKLDASWEKAQLDLDYNSVNAIMAQDFIWVHNHANTIDDKNAVLERVTRYLKNNNRSTKSRISSDVQVIISGTTAIVTGFTIIDRGPEPTKYKFMRTYVQTNDKCYLLANQTMAIPKN